MTVNTDSKHLPCHGDDYATGFQEAIHDADMIRQIESRRTETLVADGGMSREGGQDSVGPGEG